MNSFTLYEWVKARTEIHDDRELYVEKYADRVTALLNEMHADGLSALVVVNVACNAEVVGTTMTSSRAARPERVGARFLQMCALANNDEHAVSMIAEAVAHRQAFDKCSALH